MLDQDTAHALLTLTAEAGATIALVGDRAQLPAAGRGGVLDIAAALVDHTYELGAVHRFTDPDYADLTLQLRTATDPIQLFDRLRALGLVRLHVTIEDAYTAIAQTEVAQAAITTATNDEARTLNAQIREARVARGEVDDERTAAGSDGLPIGEGDLIQTRRNDRDLHVANRQTWTVQHISQDGTVWATPRSNGRKRTQSVALPPAYLTEHAHLAYASTAYGVQGATVNESHTIVTEALDAAAIYVGMTRGRNCNLLHLVAADLQDARNQFTNALARDRADRGLGGATHIAEQEVKELIRGDATAIVEAERARLTMAIERSELEAAALLRAQMHRRARTDARQRERVQLSQKAKDVDAKLADTRAVIANPLVAQATADGSAYLSARAAMWAATAAANRAGRFSRRAADRVASAAVEDHRASEHALLQRWGSTPASTANIRSWLEAAVRKQTDLDPRVVEAQEAARQAHHALHTLLERHTTDSTASQEHQPGTPATSTAKARTLHGQLLAQAEQARRDLAALWATPVAPAQLPHKPDAESQVESGALSHTDRRDSSAPGRFTPRPGNRPRAQQQDPRLDR